MSNNLAQIEHLNNLAQFEHVDFSNISTQAEYVAFVSSNLAQIEHVDLKSFNDLVFKIAAAAEACHVSTIVSMELSVLVVHCRANISQRKRRSVITPKFDVIE